MKAVVTGVDLYRWVDADGTVQEAERGDTIEVSEAEFARADRMSSYKERDGTLKVVLDPPALVKAGTKAAKAAAADEAAASGDEPAEPSDE